MHPQHSTATLNISQTQLVKARELIHFTSAVSRICCSAVQCDACVIAAVGALQQEWLTNCQPLLVAVVMSHT